MTMHSVIVKGEVRDVRYKRLPNLLQAVYVGDIYIGQVSGAKRGWSVVGKDPHPFMPVHGFKSRSVAMEFLLKLSGLIT